MELKEIDFAQRMRIATSIAGINLTEFGVFVMYKIFLALNEKGGALTVDEITDIKTAAMAEFTEHEEKYKAFR